MNSKYYIVLLFDINVVAAVLQSIWLRTLKLIMMIALLIVKPGVCDDNVNCLTTSCCFVQCSVTFSYLVVRVF